MVLRTQLLNSAPADIRQAIRSGAFAADTSGLGGGYIQGNLAILPADYAEDFLEFCQINPKPCPLVGVSGIGDPMLPKLGADVDIRTDIPRYNLYENGELAGQATDLNDLWRDDFVAFVIGCSFSFEEALMREGIPVRHIDDNRNVPMYHSNIPVNAAGPFSGEMVVSMRPLSVADTIRAIEITSRYPDAHGAPVHFGDPQAIGIDDLGRPGWGDAVEIRTGEIPVFWACGVTPQVAIRKARPPICITHTPGHMLITDLRSADGGRDIKDTVA